MYSKWGSEYIIALKLLKHSLGKCPLKLLSERSKILNLGKKKLEAGLWTKPWSLLDRRTRICNSGRLPKKLGKASSIMLFPRSSSSNFPQFTIDRGIFPFSALPLKLINFKLHSTEKFVGIWPWKLFPLSSNNERLLLKFPKHWGRAPIKLLWEKARNFRIFRSHTQEGISPAKFVFWEIKIDKTCKFRTWLELIYKTGEQIPWEQQIFQWRHSK